jgi:hypothetical protein
MKTLLFILVSFIAVTATLSGLIIISNPDDGGVINLSTKLLKETWFKNFLIPGVVLTVIVGGTNLLAVFYNMQRHPDRYSWALAGGIMISGWIIVQMILIGTFHWLQFIYLGIGILIILIAYQLKGKWAA